MVRVTFQEVLKDRNSGIFKGKLLTQHLCEQDFWTVVPRLPQLIECQRGCLMGQTLKYRLRWSTSGRPRSFKGDYIIGETHHGERILGWIEKHYSNLKNSCNHSHSIFTRTKLLGLCREQTFFDKLSSSLFDCHEHHINCYPCTKV